MTQLRSTVVLHQEMKRINRCWVSPGDHQVLIWHLPSNLGLLCWLLPSRQLAGVAFTRRGVAVEHIEPVGKSLLGWVALTVGTQLLWYGAGTQTACTDSVSRLLMFVALQGFVPSRLAISRGTQLLLYSASYSLALM